MKDFFISYASTDRHWAEWIAWQLQEAGYSVVIQAWHFREGENFIANIDQALKEAKVTDRAIRLARRSTRRSTAACIRLS